MKNFRHFQKSNPEFMWKVTISANNYMFKVDNRNTRANVKYI